jgi:hypothetical protein
LSAAAVKYGAPELIIVDRLHRAVDSLGESDLEALRAVCREILERCDAEELDSWIDKLHPKERTESVDRLWSLMLILDELGNRGVEPFTELPWGKEPKTGPPGAARALPDELTYLASAIARYGFPHSDDEFERLTKADRKYLRALAVKMKARGDDEKLSTWITSRFRDGRHDAVATGADNLTLLLDELGLLE